MTVLPRGLQVVQPSRWPRPRGYANGILVPAGRRLLFVAGQVGWDVEQRLVGEGFVAQFEQALVNVLEVVRTAGGVPSDLTCLTLYVTDRREYLAAEEALGQAYRRHLGHHYPAMALVEVAGLVEEGAKVEIEAVAAL